MPEGFGEAHGVQGALDQAVDEWVSEAGPVQELLDLGGEEHTGNQAAEAPLSRLLVDKRVGRRGRPPGAGNRAPADLKAFILSQHRHPVQAAAEFYSCSAVDLADRIGIPTGEGGKHSATVLIELTKLQLKVMEFVARYVAQPMPAAPASGGGADFTLSITGVSLPARASAPQAGGLVEGPTRPALPVRFGPMSDAAGRMDQETVQDQRAEG